MAKFDADWISFVWAGLAVRCGLGQAAIRFRRRGRPL